MRYSRQQVVELLRRAGFHEAAAEATAQLPDPVDLEHLQKWGEQRGIIRDVLVGRMGGSS